MTTTAPDITLTKYQRIAIDEMVDETRELLLGGNDGLRYVLKAPTGAGKTTMMCEVVKRLADIEDGQGRKLADRFVFIWGSLYDLHSQSRTKLEPHLGGRFKLIGLEDLSVRQPLAGETILFLNWESLVGRSKKAKEDWAKKALRDGDYGRLLPTVLDATRTAGREVILIVDEAHRSYFTKQTQAVIKEFVQPRLVYEVSATPQVGVDEEDVQDGKARLTRVDFNTVRDSGLIKQQTLINPGIDTFSGIADPNERVIGAALAKSEALERAYTQEDSPVKPLVLIQLPSESANLSELDRGVQGQVEEILSRYGITYDNGKLALWLSGEKAKRNREGIEAFDSPVRVLIFKMAVAVGWDCPRAQILVMLREMKSVTFQVQTVGRILRMPEARRYMRDDLDSAYVYTDVEKYEVDHSPESLGYFWDHESRLKEAHLKDGIRSIQLPSFYLSRAGGFGDLEAGFIPVLRSRLNKRFGVDPDDDDAGARRAKVEAVISLEPGHLRRPQLADVVIANWDVAKPLGADELEKMQQAVNDGAIERVFDGIVRSWTKPWTATARSASTIKSALHGWFKKLGLSEEEVQRLVACSDKAQEILEDVVGAAKKEYEEDVEPERKAEKARKAAEELKNHFFSLRTSEHYSARHVKVDSARCAYEPCFVLPVTAKDSSKGEHLFIELLDDRASTAVDWWCHNGTNRKECFGIEYHLADGPHTFYPDFVVRFTDGTIGIYDTKSGFTQDGDEAKAKSDALVGYVAEKGGTEQVKRVKDADGVEQVEIIAVPKLDGGLIVFDDGKPHICRERPYESYEANPTSKKWELFTMHRP